MENTTAIPSEHCNSFFFHLNKGEIFNQLRITTITTSKCDKNESASCKKKYKEKKLCQSLLKSIAAK